MDLQLYRVDAHNYLVDFRNIGYYRLSDPVIDATHRESTPPPPDGSAAVEGITNTMKQNKERGGVSGPFHFLEMACELIAELASG